MSDQFHTPRERLYLPFLAGFYSGFAGPVGWLLFRLIIGGALVVEGWAKIQNPMAQIALAESLGFYPGWFFSPLIAFSNFFGGMLIMVGFLTRPMAFLNAFMLAVTWWFHYTRPYGDVFLTPAGIEYLTANADLLTAAGKQRLLPDGGARFLAAVQGKAEFNSMFWAAGAALIACLGGGRLSLDRRLPKEV